MSIDGTVAAIAAATTWDQRVAQIRLIPEHHGTAEHAKVYAEVAKELYVEHLAPDFAYVHASDFYEEGYFAEVYRSASARTHQFSQVDKPTLTEALVQDPRTLLVFRTITGLLKNEFSAATNLVAESPGKPISSNKIDSMERSGTAVTVEQAGVIATTLELVLAGDLFGTPPGEVRSKQNKFDTRNGWATVQSLAQDGVPYSMFLHQRHYGGSFRQILDATSTRRGDLIEDAVEELFRDNGVPYLRTGSHNQADIAKRFGVTVAPAPDFVVFDQSNTLRGMLECKGAGDGGTARDKALRFNKLNEEAARLGGVPLLAVLGGIGWARVNDTLGPVIRDTDGRVFTLANLPDMMTVAPFTSLTGINPV